MAENNKLLQAADKLLRIGIGFGKAQLIMLLINWVIISIGLLICDIRLAILIGFAIAILDMLPLIGSGIVFFPWIIIALFTSNGSLALGLAIIYILLVITHITIFPLITGKQIGLKPLITLIAAIIGTLVFGAIGIILGPLIAAIINVFWQISENKA